MADLALWAEILAVIFGRERKPVSPLQSVKFRLILLYAKELFDGGFPELIAFACLQQLIMTRSLESVAIKGPELSLQFLDKGQRPDSDLIVLVE